MNVLGMESGAHVTYVYFYAQPVMIFFRKIPNAGSLYPNYRAVGRISTNHLVMTLMGLRFLSCRQYMSHRLWQNLHLEYVEGCWIWETQKT